MYKRVKELRIENEMTQTEVAKIIGMSQRGYSKYETGESDLPTKALISLAKLYNVSVDYILGITNIKYIIIIKNA